MLLAKLAGAMKASMAGAAATFAALPTQMARLLAALEEKQAARRRRRRGLGRRRGPDAEPGRRPDAPRPTRTAEDGPAGGRERPTARTQGG